MMRLALLIALCLCLAACGGDDPTTTGGTTTQDGVDQGNPRALAASVFAMAKSGNYAALEGIAAPSADGDCKRIAGVGKAEPDKQAEFAKYFSKGSVSGDATIDGDKATVPILFGPEGTKTETFHMVRIDGKWFLESL